PPQDLVRAVFAGEVDHDLARQPDHPAEEPRRRLAAVQRQRCEACVPGHDLGGRGGLSARPVRPPRKGGPTRYCAAVDVVFIEVIILAITSFSARSFLIHRNTATMSLSQSM